jgi:hydrogenase maturation factor
MNDAELSRRAKVIQSLIDVSWVRIKNREQMDLGLIEAKVAALYKSVSDDAKTGAGATDPSTIEIMESIITDLDRLALEIQANYQAVSGANPLAATPYSKG